MAGGAALRIAALLAWYEEPADFLIDCIRSLEGRADHLVACDGAYSLFPGARARSDDKQHRTIVRQCQKANLGLTMHVPSEPWATELDKRTHLFRLAETTGADWYLVIDADTIVSKWPADLSERLEATDHDAVTINVREPHPQARTHTFPLRAIFRAIPGLRVERNHYTYVTPDNRKLWGRGRLEPALDLSEHVQFEHRTHFRAKARKQQAKRYYRTRDDLGIEVGKCERCAKQGVSELPTDWRPLDIAPNGEMRLTATWFSVCADCLPQVKEENRQVLRGYGLDPEKAQVTFEKVAV